MPLSKQGIIGATAGVLLATVVVVSVYEGRVALANGFGETTIAPGEYAWIADGSAPSEANERPERLALPGVDGDGAATSSESQSARGHAIPETADAQQAEILRLRGRVEQLEAEVSGGASPPEPGGELETPFYPRSEDELQELAQVCGIRVDDPPVFGLEPGAVGDRGDEMGLVEDERQTMDESISHVHQWYREALRDLYVEATGDERGSASLSPRAMLAEISATSLSGESGRVMRALSQERAGLAQTPQNLDESSALERAWRLRASLGDELQRVLGEALGEERAAELRSHDGGWVWNRSSFRGCQRGQ